MVNHFFRYQLKTRKQKKNWNFKSYWNIRLFFKVKTYLSIWLDEYNGDPNLICNFFRSIWTIFFWFVVSLLMLMLVNKANSNSEVNKGKPNKQFLTVRWLFLPRATKFFRKKNSLGFRYILFHEKNKTQ